MPLVDARVGGRENRVIQLTRAIAYLSAAETSIIRARFSLGRALFRKNVGVPP